MESWIWIIVFIVVALWKALSKLSTQSEDESDTPSPVPKPRPQRPQRTQPRGTPRSTPPPAVREQWKVDVKQLRDFVERASHEPKTQPSQVPPVTAKPAPAPVAARAPKPAPTPVPAPVEKLSRAAQWAAAMRDKGNLRNVVVATEILGPPKGA